MVTKNSKNAVFYTFTRTLLATPTTLSCFSAIYSLKIVLQAFFYVLATPCNACNTNSLCKMTNHFLNLRTFVLLNAFSGCVIVEVYFCGSEQI